MVKLISRVHAYGFMKLIKRLVLLLCLMTLGLILALTFWTRAHLKPVSASLQGMMESGTYAQIFDRQGVPLNVTYQNRWNVHNVTKLHDIPQFLKTAFILSEDKRFYSHHGPDWRARFSAVATNVKAGRAIRGASTISEQTVRMIYPRPRTVGSRWLEGFDAGRLEREFTKEEILEFYLNQIPYAANRRGVTQAAYYYFNRDLATLSRKEMLALAVLVRAPGRMDLWKDTRRVEVRVKQLSEQLVKAGHLTENDKDILLGQKLDLERSNHSVSAADFVAYVKASTDAEMSAAVKVRTSLDANLQNMVQDLLDSRLQDLKAQNVHNGAVLAVDHVTGEILSWAVGGTQSDNTPGRFIDAVLTRRQPGSALKPFLYGQALEQGWTAATIIDDKPLIESVGHGLHSYQNYSRTFYGPVTLREALGNSLNIPALKALQYVGVENYLNYLNRFGFENLTQHPNFYGDGIALGNGEVSLFELVQAYSAMANRGVFKELTVFPERGSQNPRRVMPDDVASLMGHILSDAKARHLEFGEHSILNFPVQTAVKTGTSSDYRDSWAVGFNYRYTVGVWMGNLDQTPTDGITGSTGPALLLRSVFAQLSQHQDTVGLYMSPALVQAEVCVDTKQLKKNIDECDSIAEWFTPNSDKLKRKEEPTPARPIRMRRPVGGLHLAYDPRIPDHSQAFEFYIEGLLDHDHVEWVINGNPVLIKGGRYDWPVSRGQYEVHARVVRDDETVKTFKPVKFRVK